MVLRQWFFERIKFFMAVGGLGAVYQIGVNSAEAAQYLGLSIPLPF